MGINGLSLIINGFQHFLRFLLVSHHTDARQNLNNRQPITTIVIDTFKPDNGFHIIDDWSETEQDMKNAVGKV
jgi:hypothetical protein